jgi:hypothetical protein
MRHTVVVVTVLVVPWDTMPQKSELGLTKTGSTIIRVRLPVELAKAMYDRCGDKKKLSEWLRNCIRQACHIPLNYDAGYQEGYSAGWTKANARFRDALKEAV